MQRFRPGDRVLVLPKFAHLYPGNSGIIRDVIPDPRRAIFNEYLVEFANGSQIGLFEFQILEDLPHFQFVLAVVTFDSWVQGRSQQLRGQAPDRHLVMQTPAVDIEMKIRPGMTGSSILGQISERGRIQFTGTAQVTLMRDSTPLIISIADNLGIFKFGNVPAGPVNIHVSISSKLLRILGTFTV